MVVRNVMPVTLFKAKKISSLYHFELIFIAFLPSVTGFCIDLSDIFKKIVLF